MPIPFTPQTVNDGDLPVGISNNPITILELGETFLFSGTLSKALGKNVIERYDENNEPNGAVLRRGYTTLSGTLQFANSSTTEFNDADHYTFTRDGDGYFIEQISIDEVDNGPKIASITARKMENGLITGDIAQPQSFTDSMAISSVSLTTNSNLPSGGTWTVAGEDSAGATALAGLSESSGSLTGTPNDGAGVYKLKLTYTVTSNGVTYRTSRETEVTLT